MRYAQLLSIVLIIGMIGCSGPEISESSTAQPAAVDKPDSDTTLVPIAKIEGPKVLDRDSKMEIKKPGDSVRSSLVKSSVVKPAVVKPESDFHFDSPIFEAPVMLMAGDKPMNAGHSYPSPALIDIDNDGVLEMVLGEIMGSVSYCENENVNGGDPVWSAVAPVLMADRRPLKLNNW